MGAKAWLGLGLSLGLLLLGALALLSARFPGLGASLSWHLRSMIQPPGAGGRPLQ
jgi:hypothetical protein